jgi:hypothetical protein
MAVYSADGKKLEDTLLSLLDRIYGSKSSHISRQILEQCQISSNIARQKHESLRLLDR